MPVHSFTDRFIADLDTDLSKTAENFPYPGGSPSEIRERIVSYREILAHYRAKIRNLHDNQESGTAVCLLLSELIDRFVLHIAHVLDLDKKNCGISIIALGGYGRKELNPFSDIDLLFLFQENSGGTYENKISAMVQFLWDLNLDIGHSTRTPTECIEAAQDETCLATSLLEARYLLGNKTLWEKYRDMYATWLRCGEHDNLAMRKIEERINRLKTYHGTVQIQEPNIKESPGGLRDIHTVRWIFMLAGKDYRIRELYDSGFLYDYEIPSYEEDFDFLLRVRNAMHFTAGRKSDMLYYSSLPTIAKNLAYTGKRTALTEKFMREYYMRAESVFRLTNHIIGRFIKKYESPAIHKELSEPSGLVFIDNKVGFHRDIEDSLEKHPHLLVKIFAVAAAGNLDLTGEATSVIERSLRKMDTELPENPEVQKVFHKIIEMRKGTGKAFRLMHDHGVLTSLIPEFGNISWHYQYNYYHAYTTDEHSIRAVEFLEKMDTGSIRKIPELSEIMEDVPAKGALYLAGLLHDVGKGKGRGHSLRGERLASRALERLGYDDRTIELVRFLIREHLSMSHTSQRRDMEDDDTINDFLKRVGSTGRLRMLTLLTFADLLALSENALIDWKKALLLRLYNKTMMLLDKGYEELSAKTVQHIISRVQASKRGALSKTATREHLEMLPDQYIRVTSPSHIRSHVTGIQKMQSKMMWASFQHSGDVTLLTIITRDYPKALSDICGTITSSDINIVGAQIFTRNDGIIIDTFLVVDDRGFSLISPENQKTLKRNLSRVVTRKVTVDDLIEHHVHRWKRRKRKTVFSRPRVRIHNDISSNYTVIDVFSTDYTGLLYDVSSVFASFDIDIHTAKIGTDEDQAADAFYVRKSDGAKLEDEKALKKLTEKLLETLNKAYDTSIK